MAIPLRLLRLGSGLIFLFNFATWLPAEPEPGPVIWTVDNPQMVGGHATTVYGAPAARDASASDGSAIFFDGFDDGLLVPTNPLAGAAAFTVEVLFKPDSSGPAEQRFFHVQDTVGNRALLETRMIEGRWALDTFLSSVESKQKRVLFDRTKTHPSDRWTWVALVYGDGHMAHYIDGVQELADTVQFPPLHAGQISLGVRQNRVSWFKGGIREIRFHRTALPAEKLQRHTGASPEHAAASAPTPMAVARHASISASAAPASEARSAAKD